LSLLEIKREVLETMKFTESDKKWLLFLGVFIIGAGFYTAIDVKRTEAYFTNPALPRTSAERNAEFLVVYNADGVAHEVGDVLIWSDGSTADGLEVTTTTTANNPLVAGVVVTRTIPATDWGIMQTRGYHSGVTISVANSAGDPLVTGTTAEASTIGTIVMATGTATGEAIDYPRGVFAVAFEATTTSTTVKAILK
jgi:hypothetical protein